MTTSPRTVLLITSAAAFLSSLDLFIVNIAFPDIRADFPGTDLGDISWVLNGYTVVFAAFLALAGRLADRVGHRRVFLVGLAVFTAASIACAVAPSVGLLVAARAVQALGAALVTPTSLSLLLAAYPAERRGYAVGAWASIGAVAAALGPPLGGLLVEASWHWVFLVNVPVGLVALVAGFRVLPDNVVEGAGRPDVLGAVGLVVGVGALAYALVRAPDLGWASVPVIVGLAVAVLGLAGVVARSRRHPVPAIDLAVVRTPVVGLAALTMVAFTTGFAGMLVVNVLYLTGTWGWSAPVAGLALAVGPAVVVGVARLSGRLTARFGIGPVAAVGGLFFAAGPAWWALQLGVEPDYAVRLGGDAARPDRHRRRGGAHAADAVVGGRVGAARPPVGQRLVADQHRPPGRLGARRRAAGVGDRHRHHRTPRGARAGARRVAAPHGGRGGRRGPRAGPGPGGTPAGTHGSR